MTRTVWPEDKVAQIKPELVAPLIAALCSETPPANGQLYEAGSGSFTATRWQRARGVDFDHEKGVPEVEEVAKVRHPLQSWSRMVKSVLTSLRRHSRRSSISTMARLIIQTHLRRAADIQWATS